MPFKVVRFLLRNYYTLHYFEELVVQYGVHYDRRHFRRIYETFPVYCLFQYRSLYPGKQHSKRYLNYPLTIKSHPAHLRFQSLFFLFFAARCFAISCIGWATDSEWKRIAIGTEFIAKEGGFFIETTFFLWSAIAVLYFRFSLTSSILDYKCLAVLRISPKRPEYLLPSALDLTRGQLLRLYRFRRLAALFLHSTIVSISTLGPASVVILYLRTPLYFTHTAVSAFWTAVMGYWIYAVSALLYTNLIPFIVVAKYLHIKQQAIAGSLENSLGQLCRGGGVLRGGLASNHQLQLNRSFLEASTRYAHLQDELEEYGRFWRPYLTFIFVLYVLLIGFILFILLLTDFLLLGKATYGIVLSVNGAILVAIATTGGKVVTRNEALARNAASMLGRASFFNRSPMALSAYQAIKMANMAAVLKETPSGFSLLNGYVIQYDTLRLLLVNICVYFILIIKRF